MRNGVPPSTTSASRQFSQNRNARHPTTFTKSNMSTIRPDVNISFRFSTSLVTRVTSAPVGRLSKNERSRPCMCRNRRARKSAITTCPVLLSCATSR